MPENPDSANPKKKGGFDLGGLFGKKKETATSGANYGNISTQLGEISRRLRILESRNTELNRKIELIEKNMLGERKRFNTELKTVDSDVLELKKEVNDMKEKTEMMAGEFKNLAAKEDIEAVRKYVELWEPINFVTREEVEEIVKEMVENK
ncbi:hypothetical protein GF361_02725 [Candidatus Woesearchaeota archaeon]|nr:hypothetical protein [Candidatus Woesearchaeota archaeon]